MTLQQKLLDANLPVISADENGSVSTGPMTEDQRRVFQDILLEYFEPSKYAELLAERANMKALKDNYLTAIARLQQIQNAATTTNAQAVQAIKDMALIQERTLKLLKKFLTK